MLILGVAGGIGQSCHTRLLTEAVLAAAQAKGADIELLDLSQAPLEFAANKATEDYLEPTQHAIALAGQADGFVFASPIYRATFTGVLKNFFDLMPVEAMLGKVGGLAATGGSLHHYLALDFTFRPIMTFFNMHTVPGVLYGSREDFLPDRKMSDALSAQAVSLGQDIVYMTEQLARRGWGPPSPGIPSIVKTS